MRLVSAFRRVDRYYVHAMSKTTMGLWVASGEVEVLPVATSDAELGTAVARRFEHSLHGVPHPTDWKAVIAPLLQLARARSYNAFARGTQKVSVADHDDGTVTLDASDNGGPRHGFVDVPGGGVTVDRPTPERPGAELRAAFERCTAGGR